MMKTIEKLVKAEKSTKVGNHNVRIRRKSCINRRIFSYHSMPLCEVDDTERIFCIHDDYDTKSTIKAIKDYREYFEQLGYTDVQDVRSYLYTKECFESFYERFIPKC